MSEIRDKAIKFFKGFYLNDCPNDDFEKSICWECSKPCGFGNPVIQAVSDMENMNSIISIIESQKKTYKYLSKEEQAYNQALDDILNKINIVK